MLRRITLTSFWLLLSLSLVSNVYSAPGDVISSFVINNEAGDGRVPTSPQGIATHDGYLWITDFGTDRIYRVYPTDVYDEDGITLLFSAGDSDFNIPVTDNGPDIPTGGGLTFAENFLWSASPVTDDIIKIDPVDGDNLESENIFSGGPFPSPSGITFDGTFFWIVDWQSNTINKVLAEDGSIVDTIPGPSTLPPDDPTTPGFYAAPFGIAWDGRALWVSDRDEENDIGNIYRINPLDGALLNVFQSPGNNPKDLAWDGEFLWHVDNFTGTVYKIESGVIPFGIVGCVEKNGVAITGDVLLSQTAIADQATTTDVDGCFSFSDFTSGVPLQVRVSETGVDEKPIISLTGGDVTLTVGDTYSEPGYSALDNEDGDISANVVATPDVINTPSLIDTSAPGPVNGYTVTYDVIDSAGNQADSVSRTVYVLEVDTSAPVITLIGDNPTYVEQGSSYVEAGASAIDNRDGDISASIVVSGIVDAATANTYTLSYDVSDSTGNAATTVTRTVIVQDTTLPVITLTGDNPLTLEKGDVFSDPGASATDNIDGDLSASIAITGSVTSNTVGSYILTYNVSDLSGNNATTVTRTVNVVDTTAPIITLLGSTPFNHELNEAFVDPGASALDAPGEDLSASIIVSGTVDANTAGSYILNYNLSDTAGNAATTVSRTVVVADRTAPTITILGDNPEAHELGLPYTEAGATAMDAVDGDVTANIITAGDTVNPNLTGTYNVTFNVSDAAGNIATTQTRVVNVSDTTPPLLTLLGQANVLHELNTPYTDAGASASDNTDGDITPTIVVGGDSVDSNTAGTYIISYNVTDAAGNPAAPLSRMVEVADRTAPVITLIGTSPLEHEVGTVFVDPGATATDIIDGNLTANIGVSGSVDPNTIGSYVLTYNVSDASGNAATAVTRTINVVDTGAPSIALLGANPILHELQTPFTDPGATASDAADGDLTAGIIVSGSVDANTAGTYTLSYDVTDSQSNSAATVTRDVIVADRTAPIIVLNGPNTLDHEQGTSYTDAGATASDIIDGDLSASIVVTGSVNSNVAGEYTLNYNVTDAATNAAITLTRTITVIDTTLPVIALSGPNPLNHEVDTIFADPGASASDNIDGDITASINIIGNVDATTIGSYTLMYNVQDSSGNAALTVNRTVNVVDTGAPSIALIGSNPILHELQTPFSDPGATASDAADGDLTANIVVSGSVDPNTSGSYVLNYDVVDSQANPATTVTRNVIVADRTAPLITLTGLATINHEQGTAFVEPGATAADIIDGDVSANIVFGGSVNSSVSGTYILSYNVADAAGNSATTVSRTVSVVDTTLPVITLLGTDPANHEVGTIYTDAGATASDNIDNDISGSIGVSGSVNANVVGAYILSYNVSDSSGNVAATVTRTVNVADTGAPIITITGANPLNHELNTAYTDPGATASDVVDGDISGSVVIGGDVVNPNLAGTYIITYDVQDSQSNPAAQQTRTVIVDDFTAPTITLLGSATVNLEMGTTYTDAGATANDNIDGDLSGSIVANGTVDHLTAGTYILSYDVSDAAGNAASQVTRTVIVSDTIAPIISLLGSTPHPHEQGTAYSDAGASASDNTDGDISSNIIVSGFVDANAAGSHILSYNVSDSAGNNATTVTRTVNVTDTTLPVLTLLGDNPLNHEQGTPFIDPNASASDSVDGDISANVVVTGTVDINVAGSYVLTYDVTDIAGNAAISITRTVVVADTIAPVITVTGSAVINHEQGTPYTDSGATAFDSFDGDISGLVATTGSVNVNVGGTYTLSYSVSDAAGNAAVIVSRDVIVADTIAPIIALVGPSTVNHDQGTPYTDTGATAIDNFDDDITSNIAVSGSVDVNTPGTYTLNYNVTDTAGNAAITVTRDVIIADTTPPIITLTGNSTINVEQGTSFTDAGATAVDDVDGNIDGSIVISGDSVNVNIAGTYIIRYDVSDTAGNAAGQITRTITVADTTIPLISLIGTSPTNHQQGTGYIDAGVNAIDNIDGDIVGNVVVTGAVDSNTAGTYTLSYNVSDAAGNAAITVSRDVIVADTQAPLITLLGTSPISHEQGTAYSDVGASANDSWDGDITANLVVTNNVDANIAGSYTVDFNVSDAAGNAAATVSRTVNVTDTTAPTISLLGNSSVDLTNGQIFVDPGFTANDNIDGDITANVVVTGSIDINTDGVYVLSYDVSDAGTNAATTVTRTVNVVTPSTVSIEAETATIGGTHTVESANAGFLGSGYIQHSGEGYIEFAFTGYAVPYDLTIRYALDAGDRPLEVILNSTSLGNVSFPSTGGLTTWLSTSTLTITPQSGSNTLRLQTTGSSGANVDQLTLTPQ